MCSIVILRRPGHDWPLLFAGNRDEMLDRPWRFPARHWPDRPEVVAGLDELAGGSWLGMNATGVLAVILNRQHSLGPAPGKRSRGELVLEALDHADASDAAEALAQLNPQAYRPFNLVVADNRDAYLLSLVEDAAGGRMRVEPIPAGLHMLTAFDLDDAHASPRIRRYLPQFREAAEPEPDAAEWGAWQALLADNGAPLTAPSGELEAMCFRLETGFATLTSSVIALPSIARAGDGIVPQWLATDGPPDRSAWRQVDPLAP